MVPGNRPSELFIEIGHTLFTVQRLESALCHYIALVLHESPEQATQLLEGSLKLSLGRLLRTMKQKGVVPSGFEDRLDSFLQERNWLVHRLYVENCYDLSDDGAFARLMARVDGVRKEARFMSKSFASMCRDWSLANGMSKSDFDRAVGRILQDRIGDL